MAKEGLFFENEELIYYRDGNPCHAGVIKVNGSIYYISSNGRAVKGLHVVHRSMSNQLLKHGTYTFGDDYKLIPDSYIPPKKRKRSSSSSDKKKKRRSSRSGKRSDKRSGKLFTKKRLRWLAILVAAFALFCGLAFFTDLLSDMPFAFSGQQKTAESSVILLPSFDEEVLLCSDSAHALYTHSTTVQLASSEEPYRPFKFKYTLFNPSAAFFVSESADMENAREFELTSGNKTLVIDNLKTGTTYYYKVIESDHVFSGSFASAASTRFVYLPGVWNTRDIGGYQTQDGKTVKQGLLIRGTEIDGLVEPSYCLKIDSVDDVQDTFGFRYDMDLRAALHTNEYHSPLGAGVGHRFYNAPQYGQIFTRDFQTSLNQIFTDLADPDKYPMYMHCTYGTDRTGTVVYLLQGVLNMSERDMAREYMLSGLWNRSLSSDDNLTPIIYGLSAYEGDTLQEKIVSFLMTDCGITQVQIDSIRSIFLED